MPLYQDDDAAFETPTDWVDRSIVAHGIPADGTPGSASPHIAMTRSPIRKGDTLYSHVDRQLLDLARTLKDFDLLESRETTCGGVPAVFVRYTWMGQRGRVEQTVTTVERVLAPGRVCTSFTTTARAEDAAQTSALFDEVLKSIRFDVGARERASRPGPAAQTMLPPPPERPSGFQELGAPVIPMPGQRSRQR